MSILKQEFSFRGSTLPKGQGQAVQEAIQPKPFSQLGIVEGMPVDSVHKRIQVRGLLHSWPPDGVELSLGGDKTIIVDLRSQVQ